MRRSDDSPSAGPLPTLMTRARLRSRKGLRVGGDFLLVDCVHGGSSLVKTAKAHSI